MDYSVQNNKQIQTGTHPKKFAMWLGIASIVMLFAGLTSAYIVKRGDTQSFIALKLPTAFLYSCFIVVASSITMFFSTRFFQRRDLSKFRLFTGITIGLGVLFCAVQVIGWFNLESRGIMLSGAPNGSFIYVISGLHAAHLIGGMVALTYLFVLAFRRYNSSEGMLLDNVYHERRVAVENVNVYWHFVGALWLYLYIFFTYLNS